MADEDKYTAAALSLGAAVHEETNRVLSMHVEELDLSTRGYNGLYNAGINTVGELIQRTEAELLSFKHCGRRTVREINEALWKYGLSLKGSATELHVLRTENLRLRRVLQEVIELVKRST